MADKQANCGQGKSEAKEGLLTAAVLDGTF